MYCVNVKNCVNDKGEREIFHYRKILKKFRKILKTFENNEISQFQSMYIQVVRLLEIKDLSKNVDSIQMDITIFPKDCMTSFIPTNSWLTPFFYVLQK